MLSTLILENFKAFGHRQVIPFAPITLILGANSAGKSSILQSLLLLKQTLGQAESTNTLLLPKGDLVDLGSFSELVFRHDVTRVCEISPLLKPQASFRRLFSGALRPFEVEADGPVGIGVRFGVERSAKALQLVNLPHYWENPCQPAYQLSRSAPPSVPRRLSNRPKFIARRAAIEEYERFATVDSLTRTHPLWAKLYRKFGSDVLSEHLDRFRRSLSAVTSLSEKHVHAGQESHAVLSWLQDTFGGEISKEQLLEAIESIIQRLERLSHYSLPLFMDDILTTSSRRMVALRNFLPEDTLPSQPRDLNVEYALERMFGTEELATLEPVPDLVRLSLSMASTLRQVLSSLVYLGPLREYPERHYIFSGNVARDVGKSGRLLPDLLFQKPELVRKTNDLLRRFQIGYTLTINNYSISTPEAKDPTIEDVFGLRLIDDASGTAVSILDVGFGISQVLPVIVQSMLSRRNVILIEQPEIHLHPRLQAELGTLFAQCISEPYEHQFVVETHSEHIILRLQRLIRTGQIKHTDVSVIYVVKDADESHCYPLRLDPQGDFIDEWPEGFFEEGYREIFS